MSGDRPGSSDAPVSQALDIVVRQSTDLLAVEDPEVVRAVRFIRNNARRSIHVNDVVEQTHLSKRTIQLRFKKALGRSIYHEIRRCRIQQMADMLAHTRFTIQQIGYHLEFEDICHISRLFKKETGMTPKAYRERFTS
jgi:LacI family transcriptional regulator